MFKNFKDIYKMEFVAQVVIQVFIARIRIKFKAGEF